MDALVWEDAASYHQLVQEAQVCKALTIFIHLSQSMCPHNVLVARVVHGPGTNPKSYCDLHNGGSIYYDGNNNDK